MPLFLLEIKGAMSKLIGHPNLIINQRHLLILIAKEVKKVRRKNNESGMILPMVIIFMLALTITGLAFLNMGVMEHNLAMREVYKNKAFYLAEGGVEHTRVILGKHWDDWQDYSLVTPNPELELEGTYVATIFDTDTDGTTPLPAEKRRVRSIGTVKEISQTVQVIVRQPPSGAKIDTVLESGGTVEVASNAVTVSGLVRARDAIIDKHDQITDEELDPFLFDDPDAYFEETFNATKDQMMEKAKTDGIYYEDPINNDPVNKITWIETPGEESQITASTWSGDGIFIVNGDLKMTGGTFDGIIWITGGLTIPTGNPVINGAVFVEGEISVDIGGTFDLIYNLDIIEEAIEEIGTLPWVEFWEQLK